MTTPLSDDALRAALAPSGQADVDLLRAVEVQIRTTQQRRRSVTWPWQSRPAATWPEARRADLLQAGVLLLLLVGAVVTVAVGARLLLARTAPPQLLGVRGGQFLSATGTGSPLRTPLALAGHRLRDFNVSPDGKRLATLSEDNRLEIWDAPAVLADEPSLPVTIPDLPGALLGYGMDWVPGRDALLMNVSESGLHRLYVVDVRSGSWAALSPEHLAVVSYWPAPDARHVAVVGQLDQVFGLWILDIESLGARRIVGPDAGVAPVTDVTWAPASDRLAFAGQPRNSNLVAIWVVAADGTGLTRITRYEEHAVAPSWSPDGSWIAYLRDANVGTGCYVDLTVIRPDGSDERAVLVNSVWVAWNADSSGIIVETDVAQPAAPIGGMAEVALDGTVQRVIVPFEATDANGWRCHPYGLLTHWYGGTR